MAWPWSRAERIRRQAAEWLARADHGLTGDDEAALARWLNRHPSHRLAFERQARFLSMSLSRTSSVVRARSLENAFPEAHRREPKRGLVAAVGLALAVLTLVFIAAPNLLVHNPPLQTVMLSAGPVDRHYRLSDGTSLTLAAASVIKVSISRAERRVELETGRARIIVARDPRTFHIVAGSAQRGANQGTFLATVSGEAGVVATEPGNPATASVSPVESSVVGGPTIVRASLSSQGSIEFVGMRLDEVVAHVNAGAGGRLLLLDPSLGSVRITGIYRRGDVAGLARVLAATFDLDVEDWGSGRIGLRRRRK